MGQMGLVAVAADLVAGTCQEVVGAKKKCKSKTLLNVVNKLLKRKTMLTSPSNVLPYNIK